MNSKEYIARWETLYGKIVYQGGWNYGKPVHGPYDIPPMPEGKPTTEASKEVAAEFMVRMVNKYPHEVTIVAAGPMTDLAVAIALDPHFAEMTKELVVMGGSINPRTDDPEFSLTPRREFNLWMDPEASHAVFHAAWPRVALTTVDISVKNEHGKKPDRGYRQEPDASGAVCCEVRISIAIPVGRTGRGRLARSEHYHKVENALRGRFH